MSNPNAMNSQLTNRAGITEAQDGRVWLFYRGSRKAIDMLASIKGSWYMPEKETIGMPLTRENLLAVEILGRIEEATDLYIRYRQQLLAPSKEARAVYPPTPSGRPTPYQHQVDAFGSAIDTFRRGIKGFGNWSEMGTGKTRWGVDLMRHLVKRYAVIVGQKITLYQWEEELQLTWPACQPIRLQHPPGCKKMTILQQLDYLEQFGSDKPVPDRPHIFLINWETVARLVPGFLKMPRLDIVMGDELSRMKSWTAQMTKAMFKLRPWAIHRILMSGTPMGNSPSDFFTQYAFLDENLFGTSYGRFTHHFFELGGWSGNDFVRIREDKIIPFVAKLYSCSFRVTKAVVTDMPEKTYKRVYLTMVGEQEKLYAAISEQMYAEHRMEDGKKGVLSVSSALAKITRLQQLTAGIFPLSYIEDAGIEMGDDVEVPEGKYRMIPSVKTEWTKEFVSETLESDENAKLIIWTRFRPELQVLCDSMREIGLTERDFGHIDGGVSDVRRESMRKAFNDRNNPFRVLVCQIQAGSYGLDLPAADILIYHSNTFSFLNRAQSEDRGHRLGRVRPYLIYDVICRESVDVQIMRAIVQKRNLSDMLMTEGFQKEVKQPDQHLISAAVSC